MASHSGATNPNETVSEARRRAGASRPPDRPAADRAVGQRDWEQQLHLPGPRPDGPGAARRRDGDGRPRRTPLDGIKYSLRDRRRLAGRASPPPGYGRAGPGLGEWHRPAGSPWTRFQSGPTATAEHSPRRACRPFIRAAAAGHASTRWRNRRGPVVRGIGYTEWRRRRAANGLTLIEARCAAHSVHAARAPVASWEFT